MRELEKLYNRIVQRVNINLRELDFDVIPFARELIPPDQMTKFYAFYGITPDHPLDLHFKHSALAGSYFLGKCRINNSLLYKSDIRGDELKRKKQVFRYQNFEIPLTTDEVIAIEDSILVKTLVHNFSHDPETAEKFFIKNTLAMDYSNIHGAPSDGCFLGPFATVDLTTMRDCAIGCYSYVQAGEINHLRTAPGTIWVNSPGNFNFLYSYPTEALAHYVSFSPENVPWGVLFDFIEDRKDAFQRVFDFVNLDAIESIPDTASLDRFAVVLPKTRIEDNVLVAQRAYLENSILGKGANAQENCFIINSHLEGLNVTAHGAKIIEANLETGVFVGFNSFLYGKPESKLNIGKGSIIMPHTIIDIDETLEIPADHMVWGLVRNDKELAENSIALEQLVKVETSFSRGKMHFEGRGKLFVKAFKDRIHHILDVNGAFYDGDKNEGHAQRNQNLSLNTIQPFHFGEMEGMYPDIQIQP
ncbi:MAG: transferase [Desulfobulbaceae bacterium S3730MH12]|nr:MAG: transferase [Desulfobulbaceae bacterium S5133MH15]OEU56981.1 MAG: transferase [Desulfobulbaceae bacterium S3730MH12]OEU82156.1 MAG: transferase [Desulfobulbaceae bacterium C00003063]